MIRVLAIILALLAAGQPLAAQAQGRLGRGLGIDGAFDPSGRAANDPRLGARIGQTISMEQAVAIVARRTPGRLLDASPAGSNYRIVWVTPAGRRIDFIVDASSGAILSGG
jgi:uncharacterized membrane protein YkoI